MSLCQIPSPQQDLSSRLRASVAMLGSLERRKGGFGLSACTGKPRCVVVRAPGRVWMVVYVRCSSSQLLVLPCLSFSSPLPRLFIVAMRRATGQRGERGGEKAACTGVGRLKGKYADKRWSAATPRRRRRAWRMPRQKRQRPPCHG